MAVQLFSERSACLIWKYFPRKKNMLALAKFMDCLAKCKKILTSRCLYDNKKDEWCDALRVHFEVGFCSISCIFFYLAFISNGILLHDMKLRIQFLFLISTIDLLIKSKYIEIYRKMKVEISLT